MKAKESAHRKSDHFFITITINQPILSGHFILHPFEFRLSSLTRLCATSHTGFRRCAGPRGTRPGFYNHTCSS